MISINMNDELRNASETIAIKLMVVALRETSVDLTNMQAVRRALKKAGFGERLIVNCAERAAMEASRPVPAWAPTYFMARSRQEQAVFHHFGSCLIDQHVDPADENAVMALIGRAGFRPDMTAHVAAGAAQYAMEVAHAA